MTVSLALDKELNEAEGWRLELRTYWWSPACLGAMLVPD